MSYLNQVIKRTKPMTRCQCAVMAVLNEQWASPDDIWKRRPVYVESKYGRIRAVGYGTMKGMLTAPRGSGIRRPRTHGRNDLCPCGSGRKFKKCHLQQRPHSNPEPNSGKVASMVKA